MSKPIRIQRKRSKGWKMPKNTVYVGRPTKWGNPYVVGGKDSNIFAPVPDTSEMAVRWYRDSLLAMVKYYPKVLAPLRGKNLACWCPLSSPCHADVLLELANAGGLDV